MRIRKEEKASKYDERNMVARAVGPVKISFTSGRAGRTYVTCTTMRSTRKSIHIPMIAGGMRARVRTRTQRQTYPVNNGQCACVYVRTSDLTEYTRCTLEENRRVRRAHHARGNHSRNPQLGIHASRNPQLGIHAPHFCSCVRAMAKRR